MRELDGAFDGVRWHVARHGEVHGEALEVMRGLVSPVTGDLDLQGLQWVSPLDNNVGNIDRHASGQR